MDKIKELRAKAERRMVSADFRMESVGGAKKIVGHAARFNSEADIGGWFIETVKPGAFARTIAEDDIRCLFNHDPSLILGRKRPGVVDLQNTLQLSEDGDGLLMACDPPDTSVGRDLVISIERGDVSQQSFSFSVRGEEVSRIDGVWHRDLTDVILFDVSPVTYPAYIETDVAMRAEAIAKQFRSGPDEAAEVVARAEQEARERELLELELRRRRLQLIRNL